MISSNLALIILIEVWIYQTFIFKSRIWARSYVKNKGNYEKLFLVRERLRKMKEKLLEIDLLKK